jgi:penicillin-binding protein 1A
MKRSIKGITGKFLFKFLFLIPLTMLLEVPIFMAGVGLGGYMVYSRNLPKIPPMVSYEPRTVSTFYSDDGTVIGVFYKQKRYVVALSQIPPHVIKAFLAAEDSHFFEHHGIDWGRMAAAAFRNLIYHRISSGGSTITMQVTRKFMLTPERKLSRKIKEMILARRLEDAWGKKKILYVYLNEIYLGEGCYGVEAAARGYFDKPVEHLTVAEAAMISGLIASPSKYNPFKSMKLARHRQLVVLDRMLRFGFITKAEYEKAKNEKLSLKREAERPDELAPDFTEAVRRYIVKKYGEEKLLNEGLKVFTTCNIDYQRKAVEAVEKGVAEVRARMKHPALVRRVPRDQIADLLQRRSTPDLHENGVYQGVVVRVTYRKTKDVVLNVALSKRLVGQVRLDRGDRDIGVYRVGSVLALRFEMFDGKTPEFLLDTNPKPQGAFVCIENRTGYVRALVGGAYGGRSQFNRAIQARRQPGSAFKPVIYSVGLEEASYSPATIIIDEPIVVDIGNSDDEQGWEPKNAGGTYLGPLSYRRALELSRNICTIKLLMDVGFDPVIAMARKMGITSELGRNLSLSLGTSEVSLCELVSAYTVFPNSGIHVKPVLVKKVIDRFGNVLEDNTKIPMLDESQIPKPTPRPEFAEDTPIRPAARPVAQKDKQNASGSAATDANSSKDSGSAKGQSRVTAAMSPQTAYIMTSLLHGIVTSGTGARIKQYTNRKDLAGKTGTTNNAADTWFIGFNPDYTSGAWVGFDEKRPLGGREEGSRAALPIWAYFMKAILANKPQRAFPVPPQITLEDMLTFTGSPSRGFAPKMVREPVYTPFVGKTLVLSPLDPPQSLARYQGIVMPSNSYTQDPYGAPNPTGASRPGPVSGQAPASPAVNPMNGRGPLPGNAAPVSNPYGRPTDSYQQMRRGQTSPQTPTGLDPR